MLDRKPKCEAFLVKVEWEDIVLLPSSATRTMTLTQKTYILDGVHMCHMSERAWSIPLSEWQVMSMRRVIKNLKDTIPIK